MTLYGIPPAGWRRAMAPECGREHANSIAAAAKAWWLEKRGGTSDLHIAVGTLAALGLAAPTRPDGPDYGELLIPLSDEGLVDTLRAVWNEFWNWNPCLADMARPLHDWLTAPSDSQVRGLADYARVLIRAGLLEYTSDLDRCEAEDLLGLVVQSMRSYAERQQQGQFFTPSSIANSKMEILLMSGMPQPGEVLLEPCAGTGTMARATARGLRFFGRDPASYHWWLNDLDPLNAACCAASSALWRLGDRVTVSCGNALLAPADLEAPARARAERAMEEQRSRPILYPTRTRPARWPF